MANDRTLSPGTETMLSSKEDAVAELEAATAKWVLEKNKYTLGSLRDARAAVLKLMTPAETRATHDPCFEGLLTSFGAAVTAWQEGKRSREYAQEARDAVTARYYRNTPPAAKASEQYPCACPEGSCGRLTKYPNQYCRALNGRVSDVG